MNCFSAAKAIRLAKVIILFTVATLALMVVFGNITDYYSNFNFVMHVLSMDTTTEGNTIMYRAVTNPMLHHIAYITIIIWETIIMILCFKGTYDMFANINASGTQFHNSKKYAVIALTACCLLWFFGFQVVAGEWFGMWMGKWNGLASASRLITYMMLALIFITMKNDD